MIDSLWEQRCVNVCAYRQRVEVAVAERRQGDGRRRLRAAVTRRVDRLAHFAWQETKQHNRYWNENIHTLFISVFPGNRQAKQLKRTRLLFIDQENKQKYSKCELFFDQKLLTDSVTWLSNIQRS